MTTLRRVVFLLLFCVLCAASCAPSVLMRERGTPDELQKQADLNKTFGDRAYDAWRDLERSIRYVAAAAGAVGVGLFVLGRFVPGFPNGAQSFTLLSVSVLAMLLALAIHVIGPLPTAFIAFAAIGLSVLHVISAMGYSLGRLKEEVSKIWR